MNVKKAWALTRQSISSWSEDYAPSMGAALSYYTLFSIAPLLIIVIAVAGLFFGVDAVRGVIFAQLQSLMGPEGATAIEEMLSTASDIKTGGLAARVGASQIKWGVASLANASAVFRHDPRGRISADGIAHHVRGARDDRQVVGRVVRRVGSAGARAGSRRQFRSADGHFRADLQDDTAGARELARRVDRRRRHVVAVRARQIPDRAVSGQDRYDFVVRRRRLDGAGDGVGVLLGADISFRRGVHVGVCESLRLAPRDCEKGRDHAGRAAGGALAHQRERRCARRHGHAQHLATARGRSRASAARQRRIADEPTRAGISDCADGLKTQIEYLAG